MESTYLQLSTLVIAIFVGASLFVVSRYVKIPPIVLLLLAGILLGPEFLGIINPDSFGGGLRLIISLSVAVILFEGGLTLHPEGLQKAPKMIWRLLTFGVIITWFGSAALIHFLLDYSIAMSLLAGSLIIVTGPTVIAPLLKRIQIKEKLYHILHYEGVLIDPVGVFIALLCFEWYSIEGDVMFHIGQLSYRLFIGTLFGYFGGKIITYLLRKEIIPEEQGSIFVFASALFLYGVSDLIIHEAGILTVVIAGLVVGWANPPRLKHIQQFKSELTELAIALVFILLAANLKLQNFSDIGWKVIVVLFGVLFLIRPVSILLCSFGTSLAFNEKLFLSWIAPRGVIAGSMASLFGIELIALGHPEAVFLETFTFSVIASTIILQGLSASKFAQFLKVEEPEKKGWLIVGAHFFSRKIADFIKNTGKGFSVFLDTNADAIKETEQQGHIAFQGNALSTNALPIEISNSIGHVLAMTDNRDLNQLICQKWSELVDKNNLYRWSSHSAEVEQENQGTGTPVWSYLAKPSQISYDLKNKEIRLHEYKNGVKKPVSNSSRILMIENNGHVSFDISDNLSVTVNMIVVERVSQNFTGLLLPEHILSIESFSYKEALQNVLTKLHDLYPELPKEQLAKDLLERELDLPTLLANGVAAPHVYSSELIDPICSIIKIPKGIDLQTYDGVQVKLLFMIFSPQNNPELHLRLLAEVAKIASNTQMIDQIKMTKTTDEIFTLVKENRL